MASVSAKAGAYGANPFFRIKPLTSSICCKHAQFNNATARLHTGIAQSHPGLAVSIPAVTPSAMAQTHGASRALRRPNAPRLPTIAAKSLAPASLQRGLEEFFDNDKGWEWDAEAFPTGRAWTPDELRNKDFDDLHKLWWVCLKELNKLLSQREEARRFKLEFPHALRMKQAKLTQLAIKKVLWERRVEWMRAQSIVEREQKAEELRNAGCNRQEVIQGVLTAFPLALADVGRVEKDVRFEARKARGFKIQRKNRRGQEEQNFFLV